MLLFLVLFLVTGILTGQTNGNCVVDAILSSYTARTFTDEPVSDSDFDCALATENMFIAAVGLGFGAHIYTGPVQNINSNMKEKLEIPEGYRVISILQIGHIDKNVDATSSASTRKSLEEIVNYK